jgi:hypothetical protein
VAEGIKGWDVRWLGCMVGGWAGRWLGCKMAGVKMDGLTGGRAHVAGLISGAADRRICR